jgi:hypothetical protein
MILHVLSVLKIGLGAGVVVSAVILWSQCKRITSGILSVTAVLLYAAVLLELLDRYRLFGLNGVPEGGRSLLFNVVSLAALAAMLITLVVFIREEKR